MQHFCDVAFFLESKVQHRQLCAAAQNEVDEMLTSIFCRAFTASTIISPTGCLNFLSTFSHSFSTLNSLFGYSVGAVCRDLTTHGSQNTGGLAT